MVFGMTCRVWHVVYGISCVACGMAFDVWHVVHGIWCAIWCIVFDVAWGVWKVAQHEVCGIWHSMWCVECDMDCGQWHGHGMWFGVFGMACGVMAFSLACGVSCVIRCASGMS